MKAECNPWYYALDGVLVKRRKPFMDGDYVHVHKWEGCYRVMWVGVKGFTVMKGGVERLLPWSQFKCMKGQGSSREVLLKREIRKLERRLEIERGSLARKVAERLKQGYKTKTA